MIVVCKLGIYILDLTEGFPPFSCDYFYIRSFSKVIKNGDVFSYALNELQSLLKGIGLPKVKMVMEHPEHIFSFKKCVGEEK